MAHNKCIRILIYSPAIFNCKNIKPVIRILQLIYTMEMFSIWIVFGPASLKIYSEL